jgi:hypothetical protein
VKTVLSKLAVRDILHRYDFPHRFLVYFASQCAKDAIATVQKRSPKVKFDERVLAGVDIAERFGSGEQFTEEFLKETHAATSAASTAAYATYATYATYAAVYATYAASYATYAAAAYAYAATSANSNAEHYKPLLLSLIETRLSEVERVLILS